MDTSRLKRFAQYARRQLMEQVEAKLALVSSPNSLARREQADSVQKLEAQIEIKGRTQVIEQVAYTWFNRFCALRFMDVNRYHQIAVISPLEGQFQPEILAEAKQGYVDEKTVQGPVREKIFALLEGDVPSPDAQTEAFRLLIVAVCNDYHRVMPYLFERIDDYTELLMPDDLLSGNSVVAYTREAMTPRACEDVEVIGWLYQFYISEKKDEVFAGLKKNKKITPENIPAATQLFTPHWIVRYLVENSLGRLWLLNRPGSGLKAQMEYYIEPEQAETDFLRVGSPEELKICDPACGSGHMLTYAFDLLYAIYEEEGYAPEEIPGKILTCNLYGIEIDERAGALAAFALTMKARERQRRFFRKGVEPNIYVLENVRFEEGELDEYMDFIGRDLFTTPLLETLHQFREADNLGSLIRPVMTSEEDVLHLIENKNISGQLMLYKAHEKVLSVVRQADYLTTRYHVVVANPPYMNSRNMNASIGEWSAREYPVAKYDMFSMFIERITELAVKSGYTAMVTVQSWMFLSSFQKFRERLLGRQSIATLIQIGYNSFPELNSKVVQACAFVLINSSDKTTGDYLNLNDAPQSSDKEEIFLNSKKSGSVFHAEKKNFFSVPGTPVAYWISRNVIDAFKENKPLSDLFPVNPGIRTGKDERFLRLWYEVERDKTQFDANSATDMLPSIKWFPIQKGGEFRKWYGNAEHVINLQNNGEDIKNNSPDFRLRDQKWYFKPFISWSRVSSSKAAFRFFPHGILFSDAGPGIFAEKNCIKIAGLLNSSLGNFFLEIINPTLGRQKQDIETIPVSESLNLADVESVWEIAKLDWDSHEISWNFSKSPLICCEEKLQIERTYSVLRNQWMFWTNRTKHWEEENNQSLIEEYGLQDELPSDILLDEITLTCNPHYRYDHTKPESELEALLLADTMREFISYAVGCMFGRYSLDAPGLILANQGETLTDYLTRIPTPTFTPDADNVIPILDGEWFTDDITERFLTFLRTTFGTDHYPENLKFIEDAIGKDIRKFFLKDFYKDHLKRYKKRPIYWLFSSPKGTFNALIYMHRYRPDTVSVILNDYLREFQTKLQNRKSQREQISISAAASNAEKTKALKDIDKLNKQILELETYERDILYPLATKQIEIDLDDGVKVNYPKFGKALKKVAGLS
ncbi:MAG: BREX-1 system adenine-specific DNA-methyltransferase PglX [Cyanobacteria bacterium J06560_6]